MQTSKMLAVLLPTLMFCAAAAAEEPYSKTQGPLMVWVRDFSNVRQAIRFWGLDGERLPEMPPAGFVPSYVAVTGLWVSVCSTELKAAKPIKTVLEYRSGGKIVTKVQMVELHPDGCGSNAFLNVARKDVTSLVVVTASFDFNDISQ
jgi:hypothetical protein